MTRYGTERPKHIGKWKTPLGVFSTTKEAAKANGFSCGKTVSNRFRSERYIGWEVADAM